MLIAPSHKSKLWALEVNHCSYGRNRPTADLVVTLRAFLSPLPELHLLLLKPRGMLLPPHHLSLSPALFGVVQSLQAL